MSRKAHCRTLPGGICFQPTSLREASSPHSARPSEGARRGTHKAPLTTATKRKQEGRSQSPLTFQKNALLKLL